MELEIEMIDEDQEEEEKYFHDLKTKTLGFNTPEAYVEYKHLAIAGMRSFGGAFFQPLADCLELADLKDSVKIIRAFRHDFETYSMMYKIYLAKKTAEDKEIQDARD